MRAREREREREKMIFTQLMWKIDSVEKKEECGLSDNNGVIYSNWISDLRFSDRCASQYMWKISTIFENMQYIRILFRILPLSESKIDF